MSTQAYLDWNATAPLRPQAQAAIAAALQVTGNPSSVHAAGRAARHLVEQAREHVAALVNAEPREVVFTSGGTEANTLRCRRLWVRRCWCLRSSIHRCSAAAGLRPLM